MEKVKLSDLTSVEKSTLIDEVDGDNAGCGIIHTGKYYVLAYRPKKETSTYRCVGVELFIHTIGGKSDDERLFISPDIVLYKQSWYETNKVPFKDRLSEAIQAKIKNVNDLDKKIDDEIERIAKEKRDREQAIRDHTNKIRSCQLKIDATIKTIVPTSKSMIEHNQEQLLIAEKAEQEFVESIKSCNFDHEEPVTEFFHKGHSYNFNSADYCSEKDRQNAVNEAICNIKQHKKSEEFARFNHSDTEVKDIKDKSVLYVDKIVKPVSDIVYGELVSPSDPKYLTDLEKQQVKTNKINSINISTQPVMEG